MISNERPSFHRRRPEHLSNPKPNVPEETIKADKIQIERKSFAFALKENARGRFLRITEDVSGRRDTIIVPATGLDEFKRLLEEMHKTSQATPPKSSAEAP